MVFIIITIISLTVNERIGVLRIITLWVHISRPRGSKVGDGVFLSNIAVLIQDGFCVWCLCFFVVFLFFGQLFALQLGPWFWMVIQSSTCLVFYKRETQ